MDTVRPQITVAARTVWNAFTAEDGAKAWWGDEVRVDAREGGRVVIARGEGEIHVVASGAPLDDAAFAADLDTLWKQRLAAMPHLREA